MSSEQNKYRSDIDGLRAIAVLIVVFYHAKFLGFTGGFVGVDVFFVISGYLITGNLVGSISKNREFSLSDFYAKRVRRLLPGIFLVTFSTIIAYGFITLNWNLFSYDEITSFVKSVRYSVFGMANIFFERQSGGYFDGASEEMPFLHFWSLGVEEQFYLVWPFLILFVFKKFSGNESKNLFRALLIVAICSFIFSLLLIENGAARSAFYWMPARAWELALGGILFLKESNLQKKPVLLKFSTWFALIGVSFILYTNCMYSHETVFPGLSALVPVLGTILIIAAGGVNQRSWFSKALSSNVMVQTGLLSYGIYLWHWPAFALAQALNGGELPHWGIRLILVGLSFVLAKISLVFFENPIRYKKWFPKLSAKKTILSALGVMLFLVSLALLIKKMSYGTHADFEQLLDERSPLYEKCIGQKSVGSKDCTIFVSPQEGETNQIILWGSSHGGTLFPMLEAYSKDSQVDVTLYAQGGGPAGILFSDSRFFMDDQQKTDEMNLFNNTVIEQIKTSVQTSGKKISVLLVPRWVQYSGKKPISVIEEAKFLGKSKNSEETLRILRDGLVNTLTKLKEAGVERILIMQSFPEFKYATRRCLAQGKKACKVSRQEFEDYRREVFDLVKQSVGQQENVKVFDPVDHLCDASECPQIMQIESREIPVVSDDDHPSAEISRFLAKKIIKELDWLAGKETVKVRSNN